MILFNRELLFVHNPKTAGTSILRYLRSVLPEVQTAYIKTLGSNHPTLSLSVGYACGVLAQPPSAFKRVLVMTRNPFDREVSVYEHYRQNLQYDTIAEDLNSPVLLEAVRQAARMPFDAYLHWVWETHGTCDLWNTESYHRTEETFSLPQLAIVKVEEIETGLAAALQGVTLQDGEALPHINTTARRAAAAYYDEATLDIVRKSYAWMFRQGLYDEGDVPAVRLAATPSPPDDGGIEAEQPHGP
ncbi:sulfotransferase family protein [Methylobacterium sp. J-043]|uniref:sulfotransferase family protein n=1 Tax=Methylorubrum TaxID=2282523 RepID=UPI0020A198DE|nr:MULTISPECIES: sulfotransferase family protein [Methylorubrum]MCJ2028795.1 sulfotransferase family protein [Methylobacterium sp. J-043]MCP1550384.1 hypothetical protein [Methylorubrum zatmanii]MCP1553003.1 hypothetical protein [Methylorubrum extorquens]MCP1580687.1 hypothetical protein [Methylorubrum extorquens]